jgi:hypothetical protein
MSRVTVKDKKYTGFDADVAEFNDMYMRDFNYSPNAVNKMGLGIDEVVSSTINFSRKNYADYFPEEKFPKDVKKVGNSIKSKKMPEYIAKFLEKGIRFLLQKKGKEFIEEYYSYLDKIYNYQIPLKDICSKGKIKKSIKDYIESEYFKIREDVLKNFLDLNSLDQLSTNLHNALPVHQIENLIQNVNGTEEQIEELTELKNNLEFKWLKL